MLILSHVVVLYILMNSIQHIYVYGKNCRIMRDKRDKITPVSKTLCTPSNNPCSKFSGTLVLGETECTCICPSSRPTYMETTNNCSAYSDVWSSKCDKIMFKLTYIIQHIESFIIIEKNVRLLNFSPILI